MRTDGTQSALNAALGAGLQAGRAALQQGLASDPASYGKLAHTARNGGRAGLEVAVRAFEGFLVGQMMKQVRSGELAEGAFDSEQSRLYLDMYDQQIAKTLSEGQGFGLREALMRQLGPSMGVTEAGQQAGQGSARAPQDLTMPERTPWLSQLRILAERQAKELDGDHKARYELTPEGVEAVTSGGQWPPRNAEDFVAYLKPYADLAGRHLGMDADVLLAQSALETGWGRHVPKHGDGSSSYNLFGIKADRSWDGPRVGVGTLEYRNGVARREHARFRAYDSPAESFIDYVEFLRRNPRYADALQATSGEAFIHGLHRAGYATDPAYASKVLSIRDKMQRIYSDMTARLSVAGQSATQVSPQVADKEYKG